MSIFDRVDGTPINGYNLVEAGFEELYTWNSNMSSSNYNNDDNGTWRVYYHKPVIIHKLLIGFATYKSGEFKISDHLLKYGEFKFKVETIEDIVDIISMHALKMYTEYIKSLNRSDNICNFSKKILKTH